MDFFSTISERLSRLHPFVWLLGAIGFGALLAIFVFGVSVGTATNYAVLALFFGGHMFMHGSHSHQGHGSVDSTHRSHNSPSSTDQSGSTSLSNDEKDLPPQAQGTDHSMGCH